MDMIAQNGAQRCIQQMGGGVSTHNGFPANRVNLSPNGVAQLQSALYQLTTVHELAALVFLDVGYLEAATVLTFHDNLAVVCHLTTHFRVERRLVQNHNGVDAGHQLFGLLVLHHQSHHFGVGDCTRFIADKLSLGDVFAELHTGPAQIAQGLAGLSGSLTLLFHQGLEAFLVHSHPLLFHHFNGQIDGETVGVVQFESVGTGENFFTLFLMAPQHFIEDVHAAVNGFGEVLFLRADDFGDITLTLPQFGVVALVLMDNRITDRVQERLVDAQQLAMAGSAAQQTAQHIAAALIGGQNTVTNHKSSGADMVGDHAERHILGIGFAVVGMGDLADLVGDVHDGVHVKQRGNILANTGQTLQAHAGVDVLLLELGVVVLAVVVELGEHHVPHLNIAVAVAAYGAAGLAAAPLFTAVIVDLRAGTAGAGAVLPEVILFAKLENAISRNPNLLVPNAERLIVSRSSLIAGKDGGIEPVGVQTYPLGGGQKLPGPVDGLLLEVITEREIAQHLKVGAVAGRLADVLNVAGTDALLAGADTMAGRLLLTGEERLHGRHTGVDQQQRRVVLGNQGKAGQAEMSLRLKKFQEHFAELIEPVFFLCHGFGYLHHSIACSAIKKRFAPKQGRSGCFTVPP